MSSFAYTDASFAKFPANTMKLSSSSLEDSSSSGQLEPCAAELDSRLCRAPSSVGKDGSRSWKWERVRCRFATRFERRRRGIVAGLGRVGFHRGVHKHQFTLFSGLWQPAFLPAQRENQSVASAVRAAVAADLQNVHHPPQHFDDGGFVPVQPVGQFLFQRGQLLRQFLGATKQIARICTNARTTNTLIRTASGLLSTFAAMIAPFSVKA